MTNKLQMQLKKQILGATEHIQVYSVFSPFSKELIANVELANQEDMAIALQNAQTAKQRMNNMTAFEKAEILNKVAQSVEKRIEEFAQLIALEGGKPLKDARVEAKRAVVTLRTCAREILNLVGNQIRLDLNDNLNNYNSFTKYEPIGIVLAISAFNHPLNLIAHQLGASFAAGNCTIIKPASQTPICCSKLVDLFYEAGADRKTISVVNCKSSDIEYLVKSPQINYISFIGSVDVGWNIQRIAAKGTRIGLELGGIAVVVVDKEIDMNNAVNTITKGSFYHAGQVCVSTQLVYIHKDVDESFKKNLLNESQKLITGNPLNESTDLGPIINQLEKKRILDLIDDAIENGAEYLLKGEVNETTISPTILQNVSENAKIMSTEVFGPVICLIEFTDLNEVIEKVNAMDFAFQTSIFSNNINQCLAYTNKIYSKAVLINESTAFRVDWMPFGGLKHSGLGTGGVIHSIKEMSYEKIVIMKQLMAE